MRITGNHTNARVRSMRAARSFSKGFTLLELMIVVVVVAILASIALTSYQDQVVRSRRAAGAACLQERAQFMERYYSTNLTYVGAPNPPACDANVSPFYTVSYAVAPAAGTPRAYTLQAVPQGAQAANDAECGTLTVNQQGARGAAGAIAECW